MSIDFVTCSWGMALAAGVKGGVVSRYGGRRDVFRFGSSRRGAGDGVWGRGRGFNLDDHSQ